MKEPKKGEHRPCGPISRKRARELGLRALETRRGDIERFLKLK
jgi:hypothetical protein